MISLRLLLLVLLTLGCREWAEGSALAVPVWAGLAALGVSLGFGLLFKVSALRVLTADGIGADGTSVSPRRDSDSSQRCGRARERIEVAWLLCLPLALLATGWGPSLNALQAAGLPECVALLGWFLPSLVLVLLLELTAAQFEELNQEDWAHCSWPREWLLRLRLGQMASLVTCLAPLLLIAAATDAVQFYGVDVQTSRLLLAATLLAIGCVILFLPVWLGKWMGVSEFPEGELRQRIELQLSALKLRGIVPRLLRSEGRWPGAAIVGWFPRFRQLWLGDALIEKLTPQQLDMVVMHELAHVTGRHFLWRVFPMLWAGGVVILFSACWPAAEELKFAGLLIGSTVACVVMLVGMSLMAHQCEFEADLSACRLAERVCDWNREQPEAARRELARRELAGALLRLLGDSPRAAAVSWLHPSLDQRLQNLRCRR